MSRSHPPTLITLARSTLAREIALPRGARVLVAVSGGPDSMALLDVLARLRTRTGHELVAHGVDHGLRAEAAGELDLAATLAAARDVPFERTVVAVPPGGNLQARARAARHRALQAAAARAGAVAIAMAHHADDRAETVLLRLLQGAGPRGLAVLPPRAPAHDSCGVDLVRPFLRARRRDVEAHLARHGIAHATDPSNLDRRFLRVRVRHEVLPLLEELSPSIVPHLCSLADRLHEFEAPAAGLGVPAHIPPLPRATQLALAALAHFPRKNASVELPRGLVATYDRGKHKIVVVESCGTSHPSRAPWPAWKHRTGSGRHHNER